MTLPTFLIIGAAKSGTTSLYHHLGRHPDVFMCPVKEPNFFALEGTEAQFPDVRMRRRVKSGRVHDLESYRRLFAGVRGERAIGEASPWYLHSAKAPARIRHHVPDARLVAVLRNPVDRAHSAFRMNVRLGIEPCATFEEALADQERRRGTWDWGLEVMQAGFYHRHLSRYYALFPRDRIQVHLYEELDADGGALVADVCRHIGVDPERAPADVAKRYNVGGGRWGRWRRLVGGRGKSPPATVAPETRVRLTAVFRDDVLRLQELLGRDLSAWLADP